RHRPARRGATPAEPDQFDHRPGRGDPLGIAAPTQVSAGEAAAKHQAADTLRLLRREGECGCSTLGDAEQVETFRYAAVDHGPKIENPLVELDTGNRAVGKPAAPLVVTDKGAPGSEPGEQRPPQGTPDVVLQMGEPVCRLDEGRPAAHNRKGEPHAVIGDTVANSLAQRAGGVHGSIVSTLGPLRAVLTIDKNTATARRRLCGRNPTRKLSRRRIRGAACSRGDGSSRRDPGRRWSPPRPRRPVRSATRPAVPRTTPDRATGWR